MPRARMTSESARETHSEKVRKISAETPSPITVCREYSLPFYIHLPDEAPFHRATASAEIQASTAIIIVPNMDT
jgi:hypothetical protein